MQRTPRSHKDKRKTENKSLVAWTVLWMPAGHKEYSTTISETNNVASPTMRRSCLSNGPITVLKYHFVLVDYKSWWMEINLIKTSKQIIIHCLVVQFARYELPRGLWTNNESNIVSKEIEDCWKGDWAL